MERRECDGMDHTRCCARAEHHSLIADVYRMSLYISIEATSITHEIVSISYTVIQKEINLSDKQPTNNFDDLNVDNFTGKIEELIQVLQSFRSVVNLLLSKINIHCLHWTTHVGTGDAATTGMAAGALWGVKGGITGFVTEKGRLYGKPDVRIIPHYDQCCLHSQIDCIVSIRVGQAIHAFLTLVKSLTNKKKVYI